MSSQTLTDEQRQTAEKKSQKKALKKQQKRAEKAAESDGQEGTAELTSKRKRKADAAGLAVGSETASAEAEEDATDDKAARKAAKKAAKKAKKLSKEAQNDHAAKDLHSSLPTPAPSLSPDTAAAAEFLKKHNITVEDAYDGEALPASAITSFEGLASLVDNRIMDILRAQKFSSPTPIQGSCWPLLLQKRDTVGIAETGSGKTFAFGLPAIQALISERADHMPKNKKQKRTTPGTYVRTLIVAPTRELAIQTQEQMEILGKGCDTNTFCVYGGVSKEEQVRQLSSLQPAVVVGTPGRLLDLAREGSIDLSDVSYVVLDEADRMLDKGFEPDIRAIIGMTKSHEEGRQTCMFSATWPPAVRGLADSFMKRPAKVTVGTDELSANRRITQAVHVLEGRDKERKLSEVLRTYYKNPGRSKADRILIFALYKKEAQRVENNLRRAGHAVAGIHGDLTQQDRIASLNSFKSASTPLLVATDVAARGLDIPNVELVINYTFPLTAEDYVHRIGRTGRGGKEGQSITFFTEEDKAHAGELVRILKDANQSVPEEMYQFPTTIKKKTHSSYGAHFKELVPGRAKKITFD